MTHHHPQREYGTRARFGIATPQSNPTVEPEFQLLWPTGVATHVVRLTSPAEHPGDRLVAYAEELNATLRQFDSLTFEGLGYACTGSSYLIGHEREAELVQALEDRFGYPVQTAARAIRTALETMGVRRMAVVAPYPAWLNDAALGYFEGAGLTVTAIERIDAGSTDTRAIYELTSGHARDALRALDLEGAEAVLLLGTGLPSLRLIREAEALVGRPLLSSNYCLAWDLLRRVDDTRIWTHDDFPLLTGWEDADVFAADVPA